MGAPSLSTKARKTAAKKGQAMKDGSFPIRNTTELKKATRAVGRSKKSPAVVKAFIAKRAKALGATKLLPPSYPASTRPTSTPAASRPSVIAASGSHGGRRS